MAVQVLKDYLSEYTGTIDYTETTLTLASQGTMREIFEKSISIRTADDDSEQRVKKSNTTLMSVELNYSSLSEADAGTLLDFWADSWKADGTFRTFKWLAPPPDNNTYVVRFDSQIDRVVNTVARYGFGTIKLKLFGWTT